MSEGGDNGSVFNDSVRPISPPLPLALFHRRDWTWFQTSELHILLRKYALIFQFTFSFGQEEPFLNRILNMYLNVLSSTYTGESLYLCHQPPLCLTKELISHNRELPYSVGTGKAFGDPRLCSLTNQPPAGTHLFQPDLLWILQLLFWLGHWHHYNIITPASTSEIGVRTDWLKPITCCDQVH